MKHSQIAASLLSIAIGLGILSFVWPALVGGTRSYSEEDARQYQEVSHELHNKLHTHKAPVGHQHGNGSNPTPHSADHTTELDEAKARFEEAQAELKAAQNRGRGTALLLKFAGLVCGIVGVFFYVMSRRG